MPVGIISLAGLLRKNKYEVSILDNALKHYTDIDLIKVISNVNPDIIGIGGMTLQFVDMKRLAKLINKSFPDTMLVGGGVHVTVKPEEAIDLFDIIVVGEGEHTLLEVCQRYMDTLDRSGQIYHDIAGICYKSGTGGVHYTNERALIKNLDDLPFPAYDLLDMKEYANNDISFITILTSRGCPFDCIFCASPCIYKRQVRFHSSDYVLSLMQYLSGTYQRNHFRFMDDIFTLDHNRVIEFCANLIRNDNKYAMDCSTHVKEDNREIYKIMKEAGFFLIGLGIESGNDTVLKNINKGITVDDAISSIYAIKDVGLSVQGLFMIGNIGESEDTIMDTINFAVKYNPPLNMGRRIGSNIFQYATPYPGSFFYDVYKNFGHIIPAENGTFPLETPTFIPFGLTREKLIELWSLAWRKAEMGV